MELVYGMCIPAYVVEPTNIFQPSRRRAIFLHKVEYSEYPLKLRPARGKSLANPWDDYPAYVYDVAKWWKHNSKRRHQYYK